MNLYPFQDEAVKFHLEHHYSLNCSEMGLGKSVMALETFRRAEASMLIVFGPAFLRSSWMNEGRKLGVTFKYVAYSMIHKESAEALRKYDFWVADEAHQLKNPIAKRTHAFYGLLKAVTPKYFIGMTGTPIKNRVPDFWTLLAFCHLNPRSTSGLRIPEHLQKYRAFSRHFCNMESYKVKGRTFERFTTLRNDRVEELKDLLRGKYVRYLVKDVMKDMPEMVRKVISLELNLDTEELQTEFEKYRRGVKTDIRAKALNAKLKAAGTVEYVNEIIEEDVGPVLVFTDHLESAQMLMDGIKGATQMITGATSMEVRQQRIARFQQGAYKALIATIGSLSVGVTLTAARHVVFNDMSWVPSDNMQAEKRIHRIGQRETCFAHYIDATPTDRHIREILWEKMETINRALG